VKYQLLEKFQRLGEKIYVAREEAQKTEKNWCREVGKKGWGRKGPDWVWKNCDKKLSVENYGTSLEKKKRPQADGAMEVRTRKVVEVY